MPPTIFWFACHVNIQNDPFCTKDNKTLGMVLTINTMYVINPSVNRQTGPTQN